MMVASEMLLSLKRCMNDASTGFHFETTLHHTHTTFS
jgi:hypothetical protein